MPGDLYGLIGPNGAGKTTVFNLITGVYTPDEGSIELDGKADSRTEAVAASPGSGMSRTFQNIRLFQDDDGSREREACPPHAEEAGSVRCGSSYAFI